MSRTSRLSGWVAISCGAIAACVGPARAAVVDVTTANSGGLTNLVSVTVNDARGTIPFGSLTGVDLFHYNSGGTTGNATPVVAPTNPPTGTRAALIEDAALNTGVVNPGGTTGLAAGTAISTANPGMAVDFLAPVVNGPGIDLLLVEFASTTTQASDTTILSGLTGTGPGFTTARTSTGSVTFTAYDLAARNSSPNNAYTEPNPVATLNDLETKTTTASTVFAAPAFYATGVDLTSLGVAPGASITGLFISGGVDPVFIAGLPAVPEPGTAGLLAGGGAVLLACRSRRRRG